LCAAIYELFTEELRPKAKDCNKATTMTATEAMFAERCGDRGAEKSVESTSLRICENSPQTRTENIKEWTNAHI